FSDIANSAAAIYGIGRLGHAGFKMAKDFAKAASAARAEARNLSTAEAKVVEQIDEHATAMAREVDDEAAKAASKASPAEPTPSARGSHADEPTAKRSDKPASRTDTPARD